MPRVKIEEHGAWRLERDKRGAAVWFLAYRLEADGFTTKGTFREFGYRRDALRYIDERRARDDHP